MGPNPEPRRTLLGEQRIRRASIRLPKAAALSHKPYSAQRQTLIPSAFPQRTAETLSRAGGEGSFCSASMDHFRHTTKTTTRQTEKYEEPLLIIIKRKDKEWRRATGNLDIGDGRHEGN